MKFLGGFHVQGHQDVQFILSIKFMWEKSHANFIDNPKKNKPPKLDKNHSNQSSKYQLM